MKPVILVIEDDPVTLQFYKYIFEYAGFELIVSEDGDEIHIDVDKYILQVNMYHTH